ncbi:hypothetical protein [Chitinophaga arvensicola]|uniref:Uncharacterized protein n=1 Tax=Chitinophaga arvensicola TaxID=29529 RepID=A0A1I0SA78_9BACT|nr:hypothetical protein [Chitinophaga arvensicola]SEW53310.1 hypothetical protein SAMN04488122_5410 [Chitinophaga arvensicola]
MFVTLVQKNLLLLFVLAAIFLISIFYRYWFQNAIDSPPLPSVYNTYPTLEEGVHAGSYAIRPLFSSDFDTRSLSAPFYDEKSKTALIASIPGEMGERQDEQSFYKIDSEGKVTDSLTISNEYRRIHPMKGFLLHPEYYSTWWMDGDTIPHSYVKEQATYEQLKQQSDTVFYLSYKDAWNYRTDAFKEEKDVVLFLIRHQWHALYGKGLYQKMNSDELPDLANDGLVLEQVKKESLINEKTDSWFGTSFLYLTIQQDTLRFKHEMVLEGSTKKEFWRSLNYYHAHNAPFALLRSNDRYYGVQLNNSK